MIDEVHQQATKDSVQDICQKYEVSYLHSSAIRARKGQFSWLGNQPDKAAEFYKDLDALVKQVDGTVFACVVDRDGYNIRYENRYEDQRWQLCKTAYAILIERATKLCLNQSARLRVYAEETGKKEDRALKGYHRDLLADGNLFNSETSEVYGPLNPTDYAQVLFKNLQFFKKDNQMGQLADLVLYPVVKGGYDPDYGPYQVLSESSKLRVFEYEEREVESVKYSCFEQKKAPN